VPNKEYTFSHFLSLSLQDSCEGTPSDSDNMLLWLCKRNFV